MQVLLHEDFEAEIASWAGIGNAASWLMQQCRVEVEEGGEERTGGWIESGAENGIVVSLGRARGVGNGMGLGLSEGGLGLERSRATALWCECHCNGVLGLDGGS